jgi:hypothetical protein
LDQLATTVPKLTTDVALLLKDFGVKFSAQDLDSGKFLKKLDKPAVVVTKQKIGQLDDGSDYEAPAARHRSVTTPRKRAAQKDDDNDDDDDDNEEGTGPAAAKKKKPNVGGAGKAAAKKKKQTAKK